MSRGGPQGTNFVSQEIEQKLKKYLKNAVIISLSPNGLYLCAILQSGEILLYKQDDKQYFDIKGIHKYTSGENPQLNLFINDQATLIAIRNSNEDLVWLWMRSREQNIEVKQESDKSEIRDNPKIQTQRVGLFRSNSYDKRANIKSENLAEVEQRQLLGAWMKIVLRDNLLKSKMNSVQEDFELKFSFNLHNQSSECMQIMMSKLYSKQDYFSNQISQSKVDDDMILEITSQKVNINFANKGGSVFEANQSTNNIKQKITSLEFVGGSFPSTKAKTIISRLDNSGTLVFTVLNSPHMLYCQSLFTNFETSISVTFKLFDFVTPDDCPSFDNKGKTNLCIDDASWTKNDAFVVLIFNSFTFAVLPRLGNSLISIYNPTINNISSKLVDQHQQYKFPRRFNELIIPISIIQKQPNMKQIILSNRKQIVMHNKEEQFTISDGQTLCYTFRMEFEPELSELFGKQNMSYFFVRFCISMERLVVDQDILEKIPQMLTNKLPLFEFEKNAEQDEEEDPGQVILTASQINPFEQGMKIMETNQSFNAEFNLDSPVVLLNLKHLLMALRWNKSSPINYFQWIITVVNDCFYYFLKNSEPIYAYHALRIAEAYCKKYLFKTEPEDNPLDLTSKKTTDNRTVEQLKRYFQAIHDMYDYHNTKEYMSKSTAEKLEITHSIFDRVPNQLRCGSGHWSFQFTKNYALLVYYSLIQFRNYQAANFNILFLVFACFIMQRYLNSMFNQHLQQLINIIHRNFVSKKKSDDYELFLGKSGKNSFIGQAEQIKAFQDWTTQVMKLSLEHITPLFEQENFETLMDTIHNQLTQNTEKVDKNITLIPKNVKILQLIRMIEQNQILNSLQMIKQMIKEKSDAIDEFNIGMSIYIIAEILRRNESQNITYRISLIDYIHAIQKISIKTKMNQNQQISLSELLDEFFKKSPLNNKQNYLSSLGIEQKETREQLLSIIYLHINEIEKSCIVLDDPLFKIVLLSTAIKHQLRQIDIINTNMDGVEEPFTTKDQLINNDQKRNCTQTIKQSLSLIKEAFNQLLKIQNPFPCIQAAFSVLPINANNFLKEDLIKSSLKKISKVLKFLKMSETQNLTFLPQLEIFVENYTLANQLLKQINVSKFLKTMHSSMQKLFYHNLELVLLCFAHHQTSYSKYVNVQQLNYGESPSALQFRKLAKIIQYIKEEEKKIQIETKAAKDVEEKIKFDFELMLQLFKLAQFEKYSNTQAMIGRGFNIISEILTHPNIEAHQNLLLNVFDMISFTQLNRQNKQKLSSLKNQSPQTLTSFIAYLDTFTIETAPQTNLDQEFFKMQAFLIDILNSNVSQKSDKLAKSIKYKILERCEQLRELFGFSFDYSLYFDDNNFKITQANILGLTDKLLDKFTDTKSKQLRIKSGDTQEAPLSFRGEGSLDSARKFFLQSPRTDQLDANCQQDLKASDPPKQPESPFNIRLHTLLNSQQSFLKQKKKPDSIIRLRIEKIDSQKIGQARRKNSARRQVYFVKDEETKKQMQQQHHRKGQMSTVPGQHFNKVSFGNGIKVNWQRPGPPPGLPKAASKSTVNKNLKISIEERLRMIIQRKYQNLLRIAFNMMNFRNKPFHILLVSKDTYAIKQQPQRLNQMSNIAVDSIIARPFEFIRVKQNDQGNQLEFLRNNSLTQNPKLTSGSHREKSKGKKKMTREQKKIMIKKLELLQEKIEKVSQQACLLNQEILESAKYGD